MTKIGSWVDEITSGRSGKGSYLAVSGFIGKSDEEKFVRLYQDIYLSNALEVPKNAVVFQRELNNGGLEYSIVWLKESRWKDCRFRYATKWAEDDKKETVKETVRPEAASKTSS